MRTGRAYVEGEATAPALVLSQPLSFWGGVDVLTGVIIDRSHPEVGASVAGRILVMPGGRGSSSSSSVLAEAIRRGAGPVGIMLARPDAIITVGCIVARMLYGIACPVVVCDISGVRSGDEIAIAADAAGGAVVTVGRNPDACATP